MDSQSPEDPLAPRRRRRKRLQNTDNNDGEAEGRIAAEVEGEERFSRGRGRECPVPKPGGLIGTVLGFEKGEKAARPIVRIAPLAERRSRPRTEGEGGQG
jgi:cytochrome c oxidase assembly factor 2